MVSHSRIRVSFQNILLKNKLAVHDFTKQIAMTMLIILQL